MSFMTDDIKSNKEGNIDRYIINRCFISNIYVFDIIGIAISYYVDIYERVALKYERIV